MDLKIFSKFPNLKYLNVTNTDFDLDALDVSADEIQLSRSPITDLGLSSSKMQSGIIFAKLRIFPNLEELRIENNSLTTMDLDVLQSGTLLNLHTIWILKNNFDDQCLQQAAAKVSMRVVPSDLGHELLKRI